MARDFSVIVDSCLWKGLKNNDDNIVSSIAHGRGGWRSTTEANREPDHI